MSETKTASWIAALERARAELEGALSVDVHWRAPRGAAGDVDWAGYAPALGTNPVYRCWAQLSDAIEELRKAESEPAAARRRISLRDVLEHIRSDADPVQDGESEAAASPAGRAGLAGTVPSPDPEPSAVPSPDGPATPRARTGPAPPEPEEATVSFVIREPPPRAPAAGQRSTAPAPRQPPPPTSKPETDPGAEAEVLIVHRTR